MFLSCLKYHFEALFLFDFHSLWLFHLLLNYLNFELMYRQFFIMEFHLLKLPMKGFITYFRLGARAFEWFKEFIHLSCETLKLMHQYHPISVAFEFF